MLPQNVSRMVVGHTPQPQGINEVCTGGVWRIDIGLSSGVLGGEPQVRNPKSHTPSPGSAVPIHRFQAARHCFENVDDSNFPPFKPSNFPQVLEILPGGNVNVLREGADPIKWKPQVVSRSRRGGGLWSLMAKVFGRGGAGQGSDGEGDAITKQQCTKGDGSVA